MSKLRTVTQTGMLEFSEGRGAVYQLPGEAIATPDDVFGPPARISVPSSPNLGENRDGGRCLIAYRLRGPIIDELGVWFLTIWRSRVRREPLQCGERSVVALDGAFSVV